MNAETHLSMKLQKLKENDLTNNYIIPLLSRLKFINVEFYGGPNEEGKDIVFWDIDKMGKKMLYVAQVKHFKFTNIASSSRSLQNVVNQICNCFTKQIPHPDGSFHYPSHVYLISSFSVDTKTLKSQFENNFTLRDRTINIIDGIELASKFLTYAPDLVVSLTRGNLKLVSDKIEKTLDNRVLLDALAYNGKKDIKQIYTDIDFSLGKRSTELFFGSNFIKTSTNKLKISSREWESTKMLWLEIRKEYPNPLLDDQYLKVQELYESFNDTYVTWKEEVDAISDSIHDHQEIRERMILELGPEILRKRGQKKKQNKQSNQSDTEQDEQFRKLDTVERKIFELQSKFGEAKAREPETEFELSLDVNLFLEKINSHRSWIEIMVNQINSSPKETMSLTVFLERCKSIFDRTELLLRNRIFSPCIGVNRERATRVNFDTTRLKITLDYVIDTGINLVVLGDAGAGKSTTLQMYALTRLKESKKWIFFIPLAQLAKYLNGVPEHLNNSEKFEHFEVSIISYLSGIGLSFTTTDFRNTIESSDVVIMLDGLDEIVKTVPWLPSVIEQMSRNYPKNVQVVVSSRVSGDYLREISFFTVSILPFTDEQRYKFISKWFDGTTKQEVVFHIKQHLSKKPSIAQIVRSPLLATILCVLGENGVALPNSEINLYSDRIKLLTGYYDNVKQIRSRISVTPHQLEAVAQKLAFYLHTHNLRDFDPDDDIVLDNITRGLFRLGLSRRDTAVAVKELLDPCNVVVALMENGNLGFEHLKYQEHLAAREILQNRSINVLPMLSQPWWREVLLFVARTADDLNWLIKAVGEGGVQEKKIPILREMIKLRPPHEQHELEDKLEKYSILELGEDIELLSREDSQRDFWEFE